MARRRTIGSSIPALLVIIVGIIFIVVILRNKNLLNFTVAAPALAAGQIYPGADPVQECNNVSDGEIEQEGDRREPQIQCGTNFLNTEATVYINSSGISDTLSIKLRGPKHSDPTPESDMYNNIHNVNLGSSNTPAFRKQHEHLNYCYVGGNPVSIPDDTWVGVKAVEWNEGSGVRMLTYIDNPEGSGWRLVADILDNGGSGDCSS